MGVDVQVLSASLVHQGLEWADAQTSLRLARTTNDWIAKAVAGASRPASSGSAPCRCTCRRSRSPSSSAACASSDCAGVAHLDHRRRAWSSAIRSCAPFWAKAEALGALVYIHPGGNRDRRFKRFHLWNSVGQAFEEAMAISSLMYDGVLERLPQAQDLHLARRRLHAVLHGPHRSQLRRKGQHPRQHDASRRSTICACSISIPASTSGRCCSIWSTRSGADRVLLGSDYPVGEMKPVEFVRETDDAVERRRRSRSCERTRRRCLALRSPDERGGLRAGNRLSRKNPHIASLMRATSDQHGPIMDERLLNPISTGELERRWAAARKAMAERKIDALRHAEQQRLARRLCALVHRHAA